MAERAAVLVSACLLGFGCRYDGGGKRCAGIDALARVAQLVPVCPEQLGGLPTPRAPSERRNGGVWSKDGRDVTAAFERGAREVCRLAEFFGAEYALLKARSPSCGSGEIYDGSFTGARVPGDGVAAEALSARGVKIFNESEIDNLIEAIQG